jgi:hypothetical protein
MIQPMAARLRSTGRKSSNFRDGAFVAGAANADGITIAVINTALKAVPPPSRNGAEGPAQPATKPAMVNEAAPEIPTPAACQETARDCAVPSSGSAIALRPGM